MFILADDMGAWALGCAGNAEVRTPNLDKLAARGILLTNTFCASPVCSPARASLLTGRIPSQHGVHDWIRRGNSRSESADGALIDYLEGLPTYTEILASQGYTCGLSGKWHLGRATVAHKGHTFWHAHGRGGGDYYGAPMIREDGSEYAEERYVTDVITDHALDFLRAQQREGNPFYLGVHYTAPHSPWDRGQHPAALFQEYESQCAFRSVPDLPPHPLQIKTAPCGTTPERRRELLSGYYAAITAMDAGIGRLLDVLEEQDLTDTTLVVFTGDNGMNMGHHGLWGKGNATYPANMYDTSVRVPFIAACPYRVAEGWVAHSLFSHYDFMPTLLDFLGMRHLIPTGLPGRSCLDLWQDGDTSASGCDNVVLFDEYGPMRMIRTLSRKLVLRHPDGPNEFYDVLSDPDEEHNLIASMLHGNEIDELTASVDRWFDRHADPARDGRALPVTGTGQLDLVGRHRPEPLFHQAFLYADPQQAQAFTHL